MYRLLGRFWLREVDRELLRALRSPPLREAFTDAGGVLPAGDDDGTIEQLAIDYCRLFIGPTGHLPPYQSVWQGGQLQGTTAASMARFIDVVRYDTGRLPRGMMLDHLGVQLDVMGHILSQLTTGQIEKDLSALAATFFRTHLTWTADFLNIAPQRATTDFYRSTLALTRVFLVDISLREMIRLAQRDDAGECAGQMPFEDRFEHQTQKL